MELGALPVGRSLSMSRKCNVGKEGRVMTGPWQLVRNGGLCYAVTHTIAESRWQHFLPRAE